jgi:YD repeat-containing protein
MGTFSKREQKILDRLKSSGHTLDVVQDDALLKFTVRFFTTAGIESRDLARWFEDEIFAAIKDLSFESPITGIAIFPTIFDSAIASAPKDYLTYKRKEKSAFVGLNIDFSSWASGSREEKLGLLANNIRQSVERVPNKYLSSSDRKKLLDIASQAHKRLVNRLLHWRRRYGTVLRSTSATYTLTGKPATATDANNNTTSFTYDLLDRLSSVNDAMGRTTSYWLWRAEPASLGEDALGSYTMAWRIGVALGLAGGIIQVAFALIRPTEPRLIRLRQAAE